jgi:Peptidase M50B-like
MNPPEARAAAGLTAALGRLIRYDDESIADSTWVRRRYDSGGYASFGAARAAAVVTAWHEAGHAVAALAVGARFSSASIHPGRDTGGRVHGIRDTGDTGFVIDAAGQIAERLRTWRMLEADADLRAWLARWRGDGGDARHFRQAIRARFGADELAAWRYSERVLIPRRPAIRQVARALLIHPRHLPYGVVAALADGH